MGYLMHINMFRSDHSSIGSDTLLHILRVRRDHPGRLSKQEVRLLLLSLIVLQPQQFRAPILLGNG